MATKQFQTNLLSLESGNAPTTANLPQGHLAFGKVGGVPKIYGNNDGAVTDYTGPAAEAYAWRGVDTRSIDSPPNYYQQTANKMKSTYEFKGIASIGLSGIFSKTYCYVQTLTPWGDSSGGYPVQIATQDSSSGQPLMAIRCGVSTTAWSEWQRVSTLTPYEADITAWSGSAGNYSYTVTTTTHGKGTRPIVTCYEQVGATTSWRQTDCRVTVDASNGNVTIYSRSNTKIKIVIK